MYLCYINGKFVTPDEANLPVSDLIIQRGVGVFEAIATHGLKSLMLTPHLERLLNSAAKTGITNLPDIEFMKKIIREGISKIGRDTRVRPFITGGDNFDPKENAFTQPRFFVIFDELGYIKPEEYENGVMLDPVSYGRDDPAIKSVDYRATYLMNDNATEILYCPNGEITESGHGTFFLVIGNRLITAPLSRVLKGTTRTAILELAKSEGMIIEERCPLWSELSNANEAFVTGSIKMVVPVVKIGGLTIADGKPGAVTKKLSDLYKKYMEKWLE